MPKNYKKQQNKTNKHNIAGYVFFNFFAMITTSIPQTFIAYDSCTNFIVYIYILFKSA